MAALELIAFCTWCFAAALGGGLVGLVLGDVRLPVVLLTASDRRAVGTNLALGASSETSKLAGWPTRHV